MPDRHPPSLPFESSDADEQRLWAALADLPRAEPSPGLRRRFYHGLEAAGTRTWSGRLRDWLGLGERGGWVTAAACLLLGFGVAQVVALRDTGTSDGGADRLVALEENVALLRRELIIDRLQDESAGKRLKGVVEAGQVVAEDREVARALLSRAVDDPSLSVRSAAIDALGPQLATREVGEELMKLLESADSPIVQLALVDLVLRHGDREQVGELRALAEAGRLHPDLVAHVRNALGGQTI